MGAPSHKKPGSDAGLNLDHLARLPEKESKAALAGLAEAFNTSGHSVYSPSGSAMWLWCAGSLIPNMMENDSTSPEAAEGTVAHFVAETWLRSGEKPKSLLGTTQAVCEGEKTYYIPVTEVMVDFVQDYVDWCQFEEGEHYVETKVFFSQLTPLKRQGGTADHVVCQPGRMVITDLKYGKGIQVEAEGNTQALLYALGFFLKYDAVYHFEEIVIRIAQPRLDHFPTWTVTRDYLLEFAEHVRVRAAAAWQINAPRRPSEKACQWCKVKPGCVALAMLNDALIEGRVNELGREYTHDDMRSFADCVQRGKYKVRPANAMRFSTDELAKLRPYRRLIESWWRSVDEHLERRALDGEKVPNMKLVESRTNREFRDEKQAADTLLLIGLEEDQIYSRSLASPAQAEDLLRNELKISKRRAVALLEGIVRKPTGKPTLVPESDKRPPLDDFEEDLWDDHDLFEDDDDEL